MPMAEISGASRNEPRSGRYASRSIVQFTIDVNSIAAISTMKSVSAIDEMPSMVTRIK